MASVKKVIFVPDALIHKYEEDMSEKKLIKENLPSCEDEVTEFQAKLNLWNDNDKERKICESNTKENGKIDDLVEFRECMQNLVSKNTIKNVKMKKWHERGPKPHRNLLGLILLSSKTEEDLSNIHMKDIVKLCNKLDFIIKFLEEEKKQLFVLYEVDAKIYKKNIPLLKRKKLVMEKVLSERK
tara:strand:+ start:91 stop:642 length:552 start_codon:yes stop_codon:yes gene_type:complete